MSDGPSRVGGFLPSNGSRTSSNPRSSGAAPLPSLDVVVASSGPIQSETSPMIGARNRRSQASSLTGSPVPSGWGHEGKPDLLDAGGINPRASLAAAAAAHPGRVSTMVAATAGGGGFSAAVAAAAPQECMADETLREVSNPTSEADIVETVAPLPLRPTGRLLAIHCLTNHGDPHFVGLTGLEIFSAGGRPVVPSNDHIFASAALPDELAPALGGSPGNLVTRPHNTTDAAAMWCVPFVPGTPHTVVAVLPEPTTLGLLRVWNYNSGRAHTARGACLVEITLDDVLVFRGELQEATGAVGHAANAETFVLTDDAAVLEAVAEALEEDEQRDVEGPNSDAIVVSPTSQTGPSLPPRGFAPLPLADTSVDPHALECDSLSIEFGDTWGGPVVVGLSAIRVLGPDGADIEGVSATVEVPPAYASLFEGPSDITTSGTGCTPVDALFDADPATAWFSRRVPGLRLRLDMPASNTPVSALLIANAGLFDPDCGAKTVGLYRNRNMCLAEGILLRKAPALLPDLLFQRVRLSDLAGYGGSGPATLSASIEVRAAVAMQRAMQAQREFPEWYAAAAPTVVALPVGYTVTLILRTVAASSAGGVPMTNLSGTPPAALTPPTPPGDIIHVAPINLVIRGMEVYSGDDAAPCPPSYRATVPACLETASGSSRMTPEASVAAATILQAGAPGHQVVAVAAYDAPLPIHAFRFAAEVNDDSTVEIEASLLVDDTLVFQGVCPQRTTVVPFSKSASLLERWRSELYCVQEEKQQS